MANNWFRFKQFTINQDRCAMKVGTDGVILGALAGVSAGNDGETSAPAGGSPALPLGAVSPGRILDIGTGTGLLALMLAQRSSAGIDAPGNSAGIDAPGSAPAIDAVEISPEAAAQAVENVAASPWADRIQVINADFLDFYPSCRKKYDLIVSNPPYYRNSLQSVKEEKALARHGSNEFYDGLITGAASLLAPSGACCLILPANAGAGIEALASSKKLYLRQRVIIRSKPGERAIRQLLTHSATKTAAPDESELIIYEKDGHYTRDFISLVQPFYLTI